MKQRYFKTMPICQTNYTLLQIKEKKKLNRKLKFILNKT